MIFFNYMLNIKLFFLINTFFTGIITGFSFILSIIIIFNNVRKLKPVIHFFFWLNIFLFLLSYFFEFISDRNLKFHISEYFLYIAPALGLFFLVNLYKEKISIKSFLLFLVAISAFFIKSFVPLFLFYYQMIFWLGIIAYSIIKYFYGKKNKKDINILKFSVVWAVTGGIGFIPNSIINIIASFIKGYPIYILAYLPVFIMFSAVIIYIYYYRLMIFLINESKEKTEMFSRHTVKEKIAASLIHEIKNPIAAIQSLNQLLQIKLSDLSQESIKSYLKTIADDLNRVKDLCDSYLSAYKNDSHENLKDIDVYLGIQSVSELLRFDLRKREINLTLHESLINQKIKFDANKFKQVFLNLFYNSIEANAKNIKIYCEHNNDTLDLFFTDDGDGINPLDSNKIFQLFFSTKIDGTGIGLAICKNIMQEYNGDIKLFSSKKGQTIFKLTFSLQANVN